MITFVFACRPSAAECLSEVGPHFCLGSFDAPEPTAVWKRYVPSSDQLESDAGELCSSRAPSVCLVPLSCPSLLQPLFRSRVRRFAAEALQTAECEKQATGPRGTGLAWILTPDGFGFLRQFHVPPGLPVVAPAPSEFGADEAQVDLSEGASVVALALRRHLMAEVMELLASKKDDR